MGKTDCMNHFGYLTHGSPLFAFQEELNANWQSKLDKILRAAVESRCNNFRQKRIKAVLPHPPQRSPQRT
jgi:hypothetical protein